jgi:hypothetical protein
MHPQISSTARQGISAKIRGRCGSLASPRPPETAIGFCDFLRAPRIISNLQGLCEHEKAAEEAAEQENLISTIDEIS